MIRSKGQQAPALPISDAVSCGDDRSIFLFVQKSKGTAPTPSYHWQIIGQATLLLGSASSKLPPLIESEAPCMPPICSWMIFSIFLSLIFQSAVKTCFELPFNLAWSSTVAFGTVPDLQKAGVRSLATMVCSLTRSVPSLSKPFTRSDRFQL